MSTIEMTRCIRCELPMRPIDMSRVCPRSPDRGGCEPPHPEGGWLPSTTVRQGSTTHASDCERSDTTIWLPPDIPCSCHIPPPAVSGPKEDDRGDLS